MSDSKRDAGRAAAKVLADEFVARGDAAGFFDALYRQAQGNAAVVPWAELRPNPHLEEWVERTPLVSGRALVIGCGLGDDAELLASRGWDVTAFDISPEAIAWARRRFGQSRVEYRVADLFQPPAEWRGTFDLVVEVYTLQALPVELRGGAWPVVAGFVAPRGRVFLFARGREENEPLGQIPWPLTRREVMELERAGLRCESFEDYEDPHEPGVRRFRAIFLRDEEAH
jgi:SAM-dependent methyltransferase